MELKFLLAIIFCAMCLSSATSTKRLHSMIEGIEKQLDILTNLQGKVKKSVQDENLAKKTNAPPPSPRFSDHGAPYPSKRESEIRSIMGELMESQVELEKRAAIAPAVPEIYVPSIADIDMVDQPSDSDLLRSEGAGEIVGDLVETEEEVEALKAGDPIKINSFHWNDRDSNPGYVTVPYYMSPEIERNDQKKDAILAAVEEYNKKSCIRWVPLEEEKLQGMQRAWVKFISDKGCSSYVGMVGHTLDNDNKQKFQPISIADGCGWLGIVIHEMLHALGFFHEQSRSDRDTYVFVNHTNIISGFEKNFEKLTPLVDSLGEPYDIGSVMHYGPKSFAKPGTSTILERKPPGSDNKVTFDANRKGFSPTDLLQLNKLYECTDYLPKITTQPATLTKQATTEEPSEKPPTLTMEPSTTMTTQPSTVPQPEVKLCEIVARMGLCRFSDLCEKCAEACMSFKGEQIIQDLYDVHPSTTVPYCTWWSNEGYCSKESKFGPWMNTFCQKTCIEKMYPGNAHCHTSDGYYTASDYYDEGEM